jgi:hypothetical protein
VRFVVVPLVLLFVGAVAAIALWEGPPLADAPVGCLQLDRSQEGLVGTIQELQAGKSIEERKVSAALASSTAAVPQLAVKAIDWHCAHLLTVFIAICRCR